MKNIEESSQISRLLDKPYYPVFLDIKDRLCIVFGGGEVAERKVLMLLKFGATVRVISPEVTKRIARLESEGKIAITRRGYNYGDTKEAALVFAATDNREINNSIKAEGDERGIPVNVVDDPELCTFIVPSIVKKGPITVAISTSGVLPLFSKKLKEEIDSLITEDYLRYVRLIGRFRKMLMEEVKDPKVRKEIMKEIGRFTVKELSSMSIKDIKKQFLKTRP
ncbi:MAG: bifunctional precorrin-2 dehydrogenase/sirohydrochlorin ferrochelatase [Syntrophorhabdaceae bacterium]|nr:bifunctional precorrin-2 dehydrogenase/sirohydrochlorin ferrochelatase [Syntrophorhabdaceae bacterium]